MKGKERKGVEWSGKENRDGKRRVTARQHEGPLGISGLAFEVRAESVLLLLQAMFSSAGRVVEWGELDLA